MRTRRGGYILVDRREYFPFSQIDSKKHPFIYVSVDLSNMWHHYFENVMLWKT